MNAHPYTSPNIEIILLDNEISLQMQSMPPQGPEEGLSNIQLQYKEETVLV